MSDAGRPPMTLSVIDFGEELQQHVACRAPTARRMPISRVRSVTESSMMFMMPMPPTISETAAMLASSAVIVRLARSSVLPSCSSVTFSRPATLPTTACATSGRKPPLRERLAAPASPR